MPLETLLHEFRCNRCGRLATRAEKHGVIEAPPCPACAGEMEYTNLRDERREHTVDVECVHATDASKDSWPYKKARDLLEEIEDYTEWTDEINRPPKLILLRAVGYALLALCEELSLVSGDISHEIGGLRDELRILRTTAREPLGGL